MCACQHCGSHVLKRDVLTTSKYTVVPSYVRRRVIERERVICANPDWRTRPTVRACSATSAPHSDNVTADGLCGDSASG